jgi:hypothetical protein
MATLDADIDHLYQLPLAEFTAARNALATRGGDRRAAVQALQKPNTAAWAVNQLYWQRRPAFNRLIAAAERLRAAHARVLAGDRAAVPAAEHIHHEALRVAMDAIGSLLDAAGETPSPAVLNDIRDTLEALPADEPVGRLVRPIAPMGFAALLKILPGEGESGPARGGDRIARGQPVSSGPVGVAAPARPAPGSSPATARRRQQAEAARLERDARRAAAERQRQRAGLERRLRAARVVERDREQALARTRDDLARAEDEERRRQAALEEQKFEVRRVAGELASREQQVRGAIEARRALEAQLRDLDS